MKAFFKTLLVVIVALLVSAMLVSILSPLLSVGYYGTVFYAFFIMLFYGWWVYFPFTKFHSLLFQRLALPTWWASAGIGSALAVGIVIVLVFSPVVIVTVFPTFSQSRALDVISFGLGGGVYGLLYYFWLAKQAQPTLRQEAE